ncbi:MAG: hypothetical protein HZA78_01490 [Candidatus Schekmanbacteria bacterium]|nr:hypothetical protein [Candidatus Schekmanbacteria bacterium]
MKKYFLLLLLSIISAACTPTSKSVIPKAPGENLIWSSNPDRPLWTGDKSKIEDKKLVLVSLAEKYANEAQTRDEALLNAAQNLTAHLSTLAKDRYEKTAVNLGLDTDVIDIQAEVRRYEKQLAGSVAKKLAVQKWHLEKWETPTGIRWNAYVAVTAPLEEINGNFRKNAQENELTALKKAKEGDKELSREQAEKPTKFWAQAGKQDLIVPPQD